MMQAELDHAMTDVRRAYRLIWSYQRRAMHLVQLMGDQFSEMSFFLWSNNRCENPPRADVNPMRGWAWDMLPLYGASFLYLPHGADRTNPRKGDWMLDICILADTGFQYDVDDNEPDQSSFVEPLLARSELCLIAWQCTADISTSWRSIWKNNDWPDGNEVPLEHPDASIRVMKKTFDLAKIPDEHAVKKSAFEFKEAVAKHFGIVERTP